MAEQTSTVSITNGRVKYTVTADGKFQIEGVSSGSGVIIGVSYNAPDAATAISQYIANVNSSSKKQYLQEAIKRNTAQITQANQLLSSPKAQDPAYADTVARIKQQLADLQASNASLQADIVASDASIAAVQANAASILAQLKSKQEASVAAAQTAKPTPAVNSTTTTTTNGPTTTTQTKTTTITANTKTTTTKVTSSTTTSSAKTLTGAASDNSGAKQPNPAGTTGAPKAAPAASAGKAGSTAGKSGTANTAPNGSTGPGTNATNQSKPANAKSAPGPYQFKSSIVSNQSVALASRPGKRLQNPLGEFSSYTYQVTLYMITPDAYEAFVATGRTKINVLNGSGTAGAYVIAQSGGLNSGDQRMPGFDFDYGIDDLNITSLISGKETGSPSMISTITFKISEPYGFSFLSNLRKAGDAMTQYAQNMNSSATGNNAFSTKDVGGPVNPSRQFFVLGFRFLGYDASGRPMVPNTTMSSGTGIVDPTSQSGALFEYFIDINIATIKFKIDGKMVVYSIEAYQNHENAGYKASRGFVKTDTPVEGSIVGEVLDQLVTKLNEEQESFVKSKAAEFANKYEIVWLPGTEDILNASVVSQSRLEKSRLPGSGAKKSSESNDATATQTTNTDPTKKQVQITPMPIVQAVSEIVKQSDFLESALNVLYTADPTSDPDTKAQPKQKPSEKKNTLSWFNVTPQITEIKWDSIVKDWSYKISYLIEKYDTPVLDSPLVDSGKIYPGPHKRYDYWYTGENREIIQYEQTMDNAYMMTVIDTGEETAPASGAAPDNKGTTQTPAQPGMQTNQPRQGSVGYGLEAQNSFMTALYDLSAYAKAKITIMGDPDFLPSGPVYNEQAVYDKYYGANGYTINASGGQVFIEVDFKEPIDYTSQTGTLKINDSIMFWKYPPSVADKIKGVSYMITQVTSTFSGGAFKQVLECVLNNFQDEQTAKAEQERVNALSQRQQDALSKAASVGQPPSNSQDQAGQGTVSDPAVKPTVPPTNVTTPAPAAAPPGVDPKTGVASDNSSGQKTAPTVKPGR